ncbi:YtxH domain-containing protein [Kitasatospora sp. CMC57]|uniref:YtxH domain-containing protein n=1 Tax=Kitasatospora sp. CMC57 TaxID=3231513 RepID=A0AB33K9S0_9ACTN
MWKLTFVVGVGVGYVLGAKAGRKRYEQIAGAARQVAQNPKVQDVAGKARHQAGVVAGKAAGAVAEKVGDRLPNALTDRVPYLSARGAGDDSWGTYRP